MLEPDPLPALPVIGATKSADGAAALVGFGGNGFMSEGVPDGICYGVIVGMLIYALMMFLTFRDRVYAYFMLATVWSLWTLAVLNGHFSDWLFSPAADGVAERAAGAVLALWVAIAALFGYRFLYLRRDSPRIGRIVLGVAALAAAAALAALGGALRSAAQATFALAAACVLLLMLGTHPSRNHGMKFRGWYLCAMTTVLTSLLLILGTRMELLAPQWAGGRYLQLLIVAQAIVYSFALGLRLSRLLSQQGELHSRAAALSHAAQTDPLTGVANRAGLANRALALLGRKTRCALLIIDLDHFKQINDEFGHAAGDEVLVGIARRLVHLTAPEDMVARLGGDEFAILLARERTRAELTLIAALIVHSLRAPVEGGARMHRIGASLGIARFPDDGADLSSLLRRADKALYRVKRRGRDGYAFFDELPPTLSLPGRL